MDSIAIPDFDSITETSFLHFLTRCTFHNAHNLISFCLSAHFRRFNAFYLIGWAMGYTIHIVIRFAFFRSNLILILPSIRWKFYNFYTRIFQRFGIGPTQKGATKIVSIDQYPEAQ